MSDSFVKYIMGIAAMGAVAHYLPHPNLLALTQHASSPTSALAQTPAPIQGQMIKAWGQPVEIKTDQMGQFITKADIGGRRISVLVDTGATYLSLTMSDARLLGLFPRPDEFTVPVQTANGQTMAAKVKIPEVRVDHLNVRDVDALILPGDVSGMSLLGMSFLRKLGRVEVASDSLILRQ
jgi:aspartyl protease family protein